MSKLQPDIWLFMALPFLPFYSIGSPKKLSMISRDREPNSRTRHAIPICVIDNDAFEYMEALKGLCFHISQLTDVDDVAVLSSFPIIVCDIKDVGKKFRNSGGGGVIVSELRKTFPDKYLIIFSGGTFDVNYNKYFAVADQSVAKTTTFDDWMKVLDEAVRQMGDPARRWERLRNYLLQHTDLTMYDLFRLEQSYVKAVLAGTQDAFVDRIDKMKLDQNSTGTLKLFAGSAIVAGKAMLVLSA